MSRWKVCLSNWLLGHIFKAVTERDFLLIQYVNQAKTAGYVVKNNQKIPEVEQMHLTSEAMAILKMPTFHKVMTSMQWTATDKMVNKSQTIEDIVYAKAMLYTLDVLETKLKHLSELELPKKE